MIKMTLTAATLCLAASGAFAKAHNQGDTDVPGMDVGTETVTVSQLLGGIKGQRPDDKGPSADNAGKTAGSR